jgi:hypothetical protein
MKSKQDIRSYLKFSRDEFAAKPLSAGIATLPSLIVLNGILQTYEVKEVLEIGRGLGTITKLMGKNFDLNIYSIESNLYCIESSALYLKGINYSPFRSIIEVPTKILRKIDLVIIDGPVSRAEFKFLFLGDGIRIFFFENHQIVSKARVLTYLFFHRRASRYVEIYPDHNFEGPSYIVSQPVWSSLTNFLNYLSLGITLIPRLTRHAFLKLTERQNFLSDSYRLSKWDPHS